MGRHACLLAGVHVDPMPKDTMPAWRDQEIDMYDKTGRYDLGHDLFLQESS